MGRAPLLTFFILSVVVAGVVGALAGRAVRHAPAAPAAAAPASAATPATAAAPSAAPLETSLTVGDIRLRVPPEWSPAKDAAKIPGLDGPQSAMLESSTGYLIVAQTVPDHPSLLPARLVNDLATPLPKGSAVRVGDDDLQALRYRTVIDAPTDLYVIPLSTGAAVVACVNDRSACSAVLPTLQITHGRPLDPGPGAALAAGLGTVVGPLAQARTDQRARLAAATTAAGRSRAARRISRAYRTAIRSLAPVVGDTPAGARLVANLGQLRAEYLQLSRSTHAAQGAAFNAVARSIAVRERQLDAALARWSRRP
jgi:hypothetical protein